MNEADKLNHIYTIIKDIKTCMFTTLDEHNKMSSRPMHTIEVDDSGAIWFFTNIHSEKVEDLKENQEIQLTYTNEDDNTFLSLTGSIIIINDIEKKKKYFNSMSKIWFPNGPESPELGLLKCTPSFAKFWDGNSSTLIQIIKMGKALITGEKYKPSEDAYQEIHIQ